MSERIVQNNILLSKINLWVFPRHYCESTFIVITSLKGHRENFKYTNKLNLHSLMMNDPNKHSCRLKTSI